eukprot:5038835-Prymnesium_polylepis.1
MSTILNAAASSRTARLRTSAALSSTPSTRFNDPISSASPVITISSRCDALNQSVLKALDGRCGRNSVRTALILRLASSHAAGREGVFGVQCSPNETAFNAGESLGAKTLLRGRGGGSGGGGAAARSCAAGKLGSATCGGGAGAR